VLLFQQQAAKALPFVCLPKQLTMHASVPLVLNLLTDQRTNDAEREAQIMNETTTNPNSSKIIEN